MKKNLWILEDNRRGSVSQALGIADALNKNEFDIAEKKISYTRFSALPNWLRGRTLLGLTAESRTVISAPYPDFVISVSRRTVPVARYIKKQSPQTKLVQLMHPGKCGLNDFSLVIVPEHDRNKTHSPNIHYITGCTHRITPEFLAQAKEKWAEKFAALPKPLTAIIVGGAIKGKPFSEANAAAFGEAVRNFKQKNGGAILITTSRRTGQTAQNIIMQKLQNIPAYTFLWGDTSENPYSGFLACADNIIVTGDSVSMCCEATGTGKPVFLFCGENWLTPKHLRFAASLCEKGCAAMLNSAEVEDFKPETGFNASREVAELISRL